MHSHRTVGVFALGHIEVNEAASAVPECNAAGRVRTCIHTVEMLAHRPLMPAWRAAPDLVLLRRGLHRSGIRLCESDRSRHNLLVQGLNITFITSRAPSSGVAAYLVGLLRQTASARARSTAAQVRSATSSARATSSSVQARGSDVWIASPATNSPPLTSGMRCRHHLDGGIG
jgi:hypothetical protein